MKATRELFEQQDRIFRRLMERGKRLARKADPATGGVEHLCSNWGNDASNAAWADTWRLWRRADAAFLRMYRAARG